LAIDIHDAMADQNSQPDPSTPVVPYWMPQLGPNPNQPKPNNSNSTPPKNPNPNNPDTGKP